MNVFLSYSQADKDWANTLQAGLQKAGFEVQGSLDEIGAGNNLHLQAGKALQRADAMIVLLSPSATESPYVRAEIDYALGASQFRDRLFSVVLKDSDDIPWILRRQNLIQSSKNPADTVRRVTSALRKVPAAAS